MGGRAVKIYLQYNIMQEYIVNKNVFICNYMGINEKEFRIQMQECGYRVCIVRKDYLNKYWSNLGGSITGMGFLLDIGCMNHFDKTLDLLLKHEDIQLLGLSVNGRFYQIAYLLDVYINYLSKVEKRDIIVYNYLFEVMLNRIIKLKDVLLKENANSKSIM